MQILTVDEVAALLKMTTGQVYRLTKKRFRMRHRTCLPHFKINGNLRFRLDHVVAWVDQLSNNNKEAA
jgi:predicted DNA-binding transcriptional regulator AlpA